MPKKRVRLADMPAMDVAVAVVVDEESRVLLEYDLDWRAFSFPMSTIKGRRDTWEHAASRAAAEALSCVWTAEEILDLASFALSDRDGAIRRYHFKCFFCKPVAGETQALKTVCWVPLSAVMDESVEPIPLSARHLARQLAADKPELFKTRE